MQALAVLMTNKNFRIDFRSLALEGKQVSLDKVITMIAGRNEFLGNGWPWCSRERIGEG